MGCRLTNMTFLELELTVECIMINWTSSLENWGMTWRGKSRNIFIFIQVWEFYCGFPHLWEAVMGSEQFYFTNWSWMLKKIFIISNLENFRSMAYHLAKLSCFFPLNLTMIIPTISKLCLYIFPLKNIFI